MCRVDDPTQCDPEPERSGRRPEVEPWPNARYPLRPCDERAPLPLWHLHVDIKKLSRIPPGGGWRVNGRGGRPPLGYAFLYTASCGCFLGARMTPTLSWVRSLHQTRGGSDDSPSPPLAEVRSVSKRDRGPHRLGTVA